MTPIGLSGDQLGLAFPFHIVWDELGLIVQVGPSFPKFGVHPGAKVTDLFELYQNGAPLDLAALDPSVEVKAHLHNHSLVLRAQLLGASPWILVGTPIARDIDELATQGISADTLAPHDPTLELLLMLQGQRTALDDAKKLAARLKKQRVALKKARRAAESASRSKSEFLANVSHEIRTPLNGVLGLTNELLFTSIDEQQRDLVETILSSGRILLALLNDVLDFSKIEAGLLAIQRTPERPAALLKEVLELNRARTRAKDVQLRMKVDPQVPEVLELDPTRVSQVLQNLVGNSTKFTHCGSITLHASYSADQQLIIQVIDTGIGISAEQLPTLFDRFTQAETSTTRKYGGTGLGLAISKQLTLLMGGNLTVQSQPGEGSTFTASFHAAPSDRAPARPLVSSERPSIRPLQVLVVDDNTVNRKVASMIIERLGHRSVCAESGRAAIQLVDEHRFDVVLMDYQMPEMNGLEATAILREKGHAPKDLPIIALTAAALASDHEACLEAGMDAVITKPLKRGELESALRTFSTRQPA